MAGQTVAPPVWIKQLKDLVKEIKGYQSALERKVDLSAIVKIIDIKANKQTVVKLIQELATIQQQLLYAVFQTSVLIKSNFESSESNKIMYLKILQKQTHQLLSWIAVKDEVDNDTLNTDPSIQKLHQIVANIYQKFKIFFYQKDKLANTGAFNTLDDYIKDIDAPRASKNNAQSGLANEGANTGDSNLGAGPNASNTQVAGNEWPAESSLSKNGESSMSSSSLKKRQMSPAVQKQQIQIQNTFSESQTLFDNEKHYQKCSSPTHLQIRKNTDFAANNDAEQCQKYITELYSMKMGESQILAPDRAGNPPSPTSKKS